MKQMGLKNTDAVEISNAAVSPHVQQYIDHLYEKLQRKGFLYRDIVRMVKNDRNIFASCMLACNHGDALITGMTRGYHRSLENVSRVIEKKDGDVIFATTMVVSKQQTVFISDVAVQELPSSQELADIAQRTAMKARQMGHEPRVAFLSYSNFGNPMKEKSERIREAVRIMDSRKVDFEYDGELSADVALNKELMSLYPFCRLSGPANVLVMPALHSAHIASNLLVELGSGSNIGPMLCGLEKPVQIVQMDASVADIINLSAVAAIDAIDRKGSGSPKSKAPRPKAAATSVNVKAKASKPATKSAPQKAAKPKAKAKVQKLPVKKAKGSVKKANAKKFAPAKAKRAASK